MKNLPNEPGAWDADFSYGYLARLYARLKQELTPAFVSTAATPGSGRVFIRHDIDVSLQRALLLARIERLWGIGATYHVMLDSPFYDIRSDSSRAALAELYLLGHEIGLHYDIAARRKKNAPVLERDEDIAAACDELEDLLGAPVRSLSFHLPVKELVRGPLWVAGRVSSYGKEISRWYLSDSRARWREGDPLANVASRRGPDLQILIHPIWWGEKHAHPTVRLRGFLDEVEPVLGRSYDELNELLWKHIIYQAEAR